MKVEIGGHTVSKKELVIGTATLLGAPFIVMGAKAIAEQLTEEQLKSLPNESLDDVIDNYRSGEGTQVLQDDESYAH